MSGEEVMFLSTNHPIIDNQD